MTEEFQNFWKCAHLPVATENFFFNRTTCVFGCHKSELRWHDSGEHQMPRGSGLVEVTIPFQYR